MVKLHRQLLLTFYILDDVFMGGQKFMDNIILIILGIAIILGSVWLFITINAYEMKGLVLRFHWFFYGIYKIAGKYVTCISIGSIGFAILCLGIVRNYKSNKW